MALYANLYGPETLDYPNGAHAANLPVEVRSAVSNILTPLYTNKDKSTPAPNPLVTDSLGNLSFWAEPGEYKIIFNSGFMHISLPDHPDEPGSGGGGGGGWYRHSQGSAEDTWTAVHNLGYPPAGILVRESTGDFIGCGIVDNTASQTVLSFGAPTSGYVDLS